MSKKGLNTKVITVFSPETDDEIELFVTYEMIDSNRDEDDDTYFADNENVDIKSYEPNDDVDDIPSWVTEELVYESLLDEIELDMIEEELTEEEDDYDEDYDDDSSDEDEF